MPNVAISEALYTEAQCAAAVHGVTVERFVEDSLRLFLQTDDDAPVRLTPEQIAIVRKSQ